MTNLSTFLQPLRRRNWWVYGCAVALAGVAAWCGHYAVSTDVATRQQLARIDSAQALRAAAIPAKATPVQLEQKRHLQQLRLERDFNWDGVFQALQNANHPDIELLEFRPDKQQRVMVLGGEARTAAALSDYLQKLSAQPVFAQAYLTRQNVAEHGALQTVAFEIRARLRQP